MKKLIGVICLIFSLTTTIAQEKWTFQSLVTHAKQHRNDLKASQKRIQKAEWQAREAFSHYLPRINFKGGVQQMGDDVSLDLSGSKIQTVVDTTLPSLTLEVSGISFETGPIDVSVPLDVPLPPDVRLMDDRFSSAGVTIQQPLYTGGRAGFAKKAAMKLGEVETAQQKILQNEIVSQVYHAYYAYQVLLESRRFLENSKAEVNTFRQVLEIMADSEEPESEEHQWGLYFLELDEMDITFKGLDIQIENLINTSIQWLSFSAGFDHALEAESLVIAPFSTEMDALEHYLPMAQSANPQLQKVHHGVEATRYLEQREKAERKPIIGVEAFYDRFWDELGALPRDIAGIRLGLTMSLFQGGEFKARAAQHRSRYRELEDLERFLGQYLETQTIALFSELDSLKNRIDLDVEKRKITDERVKLALFGFKNGISEFDDYIDAFIARSTVTAEMLNRKKEFLQKKSALIKTLGIRAASLNHSEGQR